MTGLITIDNTTRSRSKAHWLAGGRLSWLDQGENLEVALWVKNISDTKYRVETFEFSAAGWITSVPNRPRSFGAEVTYSLVKAYSRYCCSIR